jgi:membrane-bound ClpP family serine protease
MGLCIVGFVLLLINYLYAKFNEPLVLIGFIAMLVGTIFSFVAFAKNEAGFLKFFAAGAFFVVTFLICALDPFQVIRMMAWLKN